jgi:hypothetical protein
MGLVGGRGVGGGMSAASEAAKRAPRAGPGGYCSMKRRGRARDREKEDGVAREGARSPGRERGSPGKGRERAERRQLNAVQA